MKTASLYLSALALSGFTAAHAAEQTLAPVVVTATRYQYNDTDAPYASEVHTAKEIANSGAVNLYDFLSQNSSVTVMPSYGNPFSQRLDMRGFGIGDGYQNIVVTVDGRRLNNIDMVPQLLSAIPLSSIDRIEITKGSGSVLYGDGATAGAIHIYTRDTHGASIAIAGGNHGVVTTSANVGASSQQASLSVSTENYRQDGFSNPDTNGTRDIATSNNTHALLKLYATDSLELRLGKDLSWIDTRYPNPLSEAQFDNNPAQNGGKAYSQQRYSDDNSLYGLTADLNHDFQLTVDHHDEQKVSEFVTYASKSKYDYRSNDVALHYRHGGIGMVAGLQDFNGTRKSSSNHTSKDNSAFYLQGHYSHEKTTLSLGGRRETVKYRYSPTTGTALSDDRKLNAWDAGINQRLNARLSLFANYNVGYEAPDIDRFFNYTGTFNAFIVPAKSRTVNLGLNHVTANNKLKLTLFHTAMRDEIYYNTVTYTNTNIHRSHKYGLDLEETHRFGERLSGTALYSYTRAIIDKQSATDSSYNGNDLPGVSDHTLTVSANYTPGDRSRLVVSHTYRSASYASGDFANSFGKKQRAYNSTDLNYSYKLQKIELFATVQNLFANDNALWLVSGGKLYAYPANFTRNWRVGVKAQF